MRMRLGSVSSAAGLDGQQDILQPGVFRVDVVDVVGGDEAGLVARAQAPAACLLSSGSSGMSCCCSSRKKRSAPKTS